MGGNTPCLVISGLYFSDPISWVMNGLHSPLSPPRYPQKGWFGLCCIVMVTLPWAQCEISRKSIMCVYLKPDRVAIKAQQSLLYVGPSEMHIQVPNNISGTQE